MTAELEQAMNLAPFVDTRGRIVLEGDLVSLVRDGESSELATVTRLKRVWLTYKRMEDGTVGFLTKTSCAVSLTIREDRS